MRKVIIFATLLLFLILILFLFKEKILQAQSNIGIELYVYPQGFYGTATPIKIENASDDRYKTPLKSTVVAGTEYKMVLSGVGNNNFTLIFSNISLSYNTSSTSNCSGFYGKLVGNDDCIIEGTFNEPNSNYEKWNITVIQGSKSASTSFYLVKQSYAQTSTIFSKNDQYYLEPTSTTTQPTSTITYNVYSNKLYCPIYMANGQSTTTPSPSPGRFVHFNVASSSFINRDFIPTNLRLEGVTPRIYNLYLVNSGNQIIGPPSPVQVTINVTPPFTPPPGSFECRGAPNNWCRCVFSYCYWYDYNRTRWVPTSSSACGNVCAGGIRE